MQSASTKSIASKQGKTNVWKGSVAQKKPSALSHSQESLNRAIDNNILLQTGGELYHEQYDEHGVKIENQCFPY